MHLASITLSALAVALAGITTLAPADARCQVRLRYTGSLTGEPGPTWDPETPLTSEICEGSCPTSGACKLSSKVISATQTDFWCECPSGTGDAGCRGTIVKITNHAGFTLKLVCSDGGCSETQVCDWTDAANPRGHGPGSGGR